MSSITNQYKKSREYLTNVSSICYDSIPYKYMDIPSTLRQNSYLKINKGLRTHENNHWNINQV